MFVRMVQVLDFHMSVASPVASWQMCADAFLGSLNISIVSVVQNHHLHITKECFHGIIVRTSLGQTNPVQLQLSHHSPRNPRLTRMRSVLIQGNPHHLLRIPPAHLAQETTDILRTLARQVRPAGACAAHIVEGKQIELSASLLWARQYQALGRSIAESPVGFDEDWFDIEEQQHSLARKMAPNQANSAQNGPPAGIIAYDLAPDSTKVEAPFLSGRRRCSRLMTLTTQCLPR